MNRLPAAPELHLSGARLIAAQIAALLVYLACLSVFVQALPARFAGLHTPAAELSLPAIYPTLALLGEALVMLVYLFCGGLLFAIRPHDWRALLCAAGFPAFAIHMAPTVLPWMSLNPLNNLVGDLLKATGIGMGLLFLFLFPTGRFIPGLTRWAFGAALVGFLLWLIFPASLFDFGDPYRMSLGSALFLSAWWLTGVIALVYRYRFHLSTLERQQVKLVTLGMSLLACVYFILIALREFLLLQGTEPARSAFELFAPQVNFLLSISSPSLITLSILRYRLWDFDLVVRRTLVYSAVTLVLALVYFLAVTALQSLFVSLSDQQSPLSIVLSTLAIAALFNPLRLRVQEFIDRRFYRQKYNAEQTLTRFAALARKEVGIDQLSTALLTVVKEVLQPVHNSLWLN